MKILQVTPRYPPQSGGVETHVKEISERLVECGHEVTVITADAGHEGERRERRNGVSVCRYRSVAPHGAMHFCPQITAAVRRSDADVVHAHNYHSFPLFFAAVGVGDQRFVVTTHYHGGSASTVRDRLLSLYRPFGRWAVQRADEVIAVSNWEHRELEANFDVDARVIPNGINVERFADIEPKSTKPYLLCVSRLEEYKGIQYAIRALNQLSNYDLMIAGEGVYQSELERIAGRQDVTDRVEFLGYVSDDQLPQLYAGASVFLSLSSREAYGITVGEALASGTPCVVLRGSALNDWADRSDCVAIDSPSPASVASAVKQATSRKTDLSRISTWESVVDDYTQVYDSVFDCVDHRGPE